MRTLLNVCNEFEIYYTRLNRINLDANKMLALITYKNLFPRDFCNLQLNRGFVHALFAQKDDLALSTLQQLREEKDDISDAIEAIETEHLEAEEELDDVYEAKKSRLSTHPYHGPAVYTDEGKWQAKQYDSEKAKRLLDIQRKHYGSLRQLKTNRAQIEKGIALAKSKALKELITRDNIEAVFSPAHVSETGVENEFGEIRSNDYFNLLRYLIRNGFIDETYPDYMTYFYENSTTLNDKKFLRQVTDQRGAQYGYKLNDSQRIFASVAVKNAISGRQVEALNFDLFGYLLKHQDSETCSEHLEALMGQLKETGNYGFIWEFYQLERETSQLIKTLAAQWETYFNEVFVGEALPEEMLRKFSHDILLHADKAAIEAININSFLTDYISESRDYGALDSPNIGKLIEGFKLLDVKFIGIDYESWNKELFDEIYRNSLYQLTFENITLMLEKQYGCENQGDIAHKNFTLIRKQPESPLALYVKNNISEYLDIVLNNCGERINDTEDIAVSLLNNEGIGPQTKSRYIRYLKTKLRDITAAKDESLWSHLIQHSVVQFTANNMYIYFSRTEKMDDELIEFINKTDEEIDLKSIAFDSPIGREIFHSAVTCNKIKNDKYRQIVKSRNYINPPYPNFHIPGISDEKFLILVEHKTIGMDPVSLQFVRENYAKQKMAFIKENLDEYLDILTPELFDEEEKLDILTWDVENEKKINLLK